MGKAESEYSSRAEPGIKKSVERESRLDEWTWTYRATGSSPLEFTDLPVDVPKYLASIDGEDSIFEFVHLDEFADVIGLTVQQVDELCDYWSIEYDQSRMVNDGLVGTVWRKAVRLGLCDAASVIEHQKTRNTRPSKRTKIPKKLRFEVFKRDLGKCQYCGRGAPDVVMHVDHKVPLAKGGTTTLDNLQLLCEEDNLAKSDRPDWKP